MNSEDGPFLVRSSDGDVLRCTRWKDGRFHVFERGPLAELLDADFILAIPPLARAIQDACGADIRVTPTQLMNVVTGRIWGDYYEIRPADELVLKRLLTVDRSGRRAWHIGGKHLLVTGLVAAELKAAGFRSLDFVPRERTRRLLTPYE